MTPEYLDAMATWLPDSEWTTLMLLVDDTTAMSTKARAPMAMLSAEERAALAIAQTALLDEARTLGERVANLRARLEVYARSFGADPVAAANSG